jgi:hypothetical protein
MYEHLPDHCLQASMETNGPVWSSVLEAAALSVLFRAGLALVAAVFLAAFAFVVADVFAMMSNCCKNYAIIN